MAFLAELGVEGILEVADYLGVDVIEESFLQDLEDAAQWITRTGNELSVPATRRRVIQRLLPYGSGLQYAASRVLLRELGETGIPATGRLAVRRVVGFIKKHWKTIGGLIGIFRNRPTKGMHPSGHSAKKPYHIKGPNHFRISKGGVHYPTGKTGRDPNMPLTGDMLDKYGRILRPGRSSKMYRFGNFRMGKLKKGKKVRGCSKMRSRGICVQDDGEATITGSRTVYLLHYSMPHATTLLALSHALAKMIGVKLSGRVPMSLNDEFCNLGLAVDGYTIVISYRATNDATTVQVSTISVAVTATYLEVGRQIRDFLFSMVTDVGEVPLIEEIEAKQNYQTTLTNFVNARPFTWKASEITLVVRGISALKFVNVTQTLATGGSTDRHDINAQPLEGREYYGSGSQFRPKMFSHTASEGEGIITSDPITGVKDFVWDAFTNGDIDRLFEHPPNHKSFYGFNYHRFVRLAPGRMHKSLVSSSHKLTLNRWIKVLHPALAHTNNTALTTSAINPKTSIGNTKMYGFDKVIHNVGDADTKLDYEYHVKMVAAAYHHRKKSITATYPAID